MDEGLEVDCDWILGHALDQVGGAARKADAPAGHRVGLGDPVDGDGALQQPGLDLGHRVEAEVVVDQMPVDVVGEHAHIGMIDQYVRDGGHLVPRVGRARGVAGRVEHQPAGTGRDRGGERLRPELEPVGRAGRHDHRRPFRQHHHVGVGDPVGRRHDHLVARIEARHQRVVEHVLGAGAHADLVGRVVEIVLPRELAGDRLLQRGQAVDAGVLGLARLNRLDAGGLDGVRRVEVGLAGAEADHVLAGGLEVGGHGGDRHRGRGFDAPEALRQVDHGNSCVERGRQPTRRGAGLQAAGSRHNVLSLPFRPDAGRRAKP